MVRRRRPQTGARRYLSRHWVRSSSRANQLTSDSQSYSPSWSLRGSPLQGPVTQPEPTAVPPIQGPNNSLAHQTRSYATATQQWLSTQTESTSDSPELLENLCEQHGDVQPHDGSPKLPASSLSSKAVPRRPRPAFLGCHLPIPATEVAETKPFPLTAPTYTAKELSLPRQYNTDYPHPLTVYASPAVNPASVAASGYAPLLEALQERPHEMMGHILAECGKPDVTALGLTLDRDSKDGCGIPEKYWLRLSSWDGVKVPLGAVVPYARSTRAAAPRPASTRLGSSPSQMNAPLRQSPSLPDLRPHSDAELGELAAMARHARRASVDAGVKSVALAQMNAERRGGFCLE